MNGMPFCCLEGTDRLILNGNLLPANPCLLPLEYCQPVDRGLIQSECIERETLAWDMQWRIQRLHARIVTNSHDG